MSRKITNLLLEMIEEGVLDKDAVILACFKYMSEDDVKDMAEANDFIIEDDENLDDDTVEEDDLYLDREATEKARQEHEEFMQEWEREF